MRGGGVELGEVLVGTGKADAAKAAADEDRVEDRLVGAGGGRIIGEVSGAGGVDVAGRVEHESAAADAEGGEFDGRAGGVQLHEERPLDGSCGRVRARRRDKGGI